MSRITSVSVEEVNRPLSDPFEISLGTRQEATNVLITVKTSTGTTGYGEGSPIPPVTGETQESAAAVARTAADLIKGEDVADYRRLVRTVRSTFPGAYSALFAVETAVLDAYCREEDLPLAALFGGRPEPVMTDVTIPMVAPERAADRAREVTEEGYSQLKIKTGSDLREDVKRVRAIAQAAPDASLKVDANQGWTVTETVQFYEALNDDAICIDLIEQPVSASDVAGLAQVRDRIDVPVAADEAVFTPADAVRVVREEAADIINIKLAKSGPLAAAEIAAIADGANLDLMIGCMLESAIGIHASAHIVAGLGLFSYVDLDGNRLLAKDLVDDAGPIHEISGPGHGVTP